MNSVKTISNWFASVGISELGVGYGDDYLGLRGPWNKDSILSDCHRCALVATSAFTHITLNKRKWQFTVSCLHGSLLIQGNGLLRVLVPREWNTKKSIFPVASLPQVAVRNLGNTVVNCLDISLCFLSYFSPFLYLSIAKYAGDWIAKIIFVSGFNLKERGVR